MFISIVHNQSGTQELLRRLAPHESIDPEYHCEKWAIANDVSIAKPDGYIPSGCADYYAETRDTKEATGSCWKSFDFYLESDESD
jgi:hypothetical protein